MGREEKPLPVIEQIKDILNSNPEQINELVFGELKFEIRNGVVYKIYLSNSVLIKGDKSNESK